MEGCYDRKAAVCVLYMYTPCCSVYYSQVYIILKCISVISAALFGSLESCLKIVLELTRHSIHGNIEGVL